MSNYQQRIYEDKELAVMWCRLNAGRHPIRDDWKFDPENIPGAMALIVNLIGPSKCLAMWRKGNFMESGPAMIERRKRPRD